MMGYSDFVNKIQRKYTKRYARIRNSFGVYDCYKAVRKHQWYDIGRPLKEHEFYAIVREVNSLLADEIALGNTVKFPIKMGKLELRKSQRGAKIIDGKLKVSYPINWKRTMELWYNDREAMKNKTLLRDEEKYVYHIRYCKYDADYENKCFYEFSLNRFIKIALKENIKKGLIDTLW